MNLVARRTRVERTSFRNLRKGGIYYSAAGTSGPLVKLRDRQTLVANGAPFASNNATGTAVADTSTGIERIGKYFLGQKAP